MTHGALRDRGITLEVLAPAQAESATSPRGMRETFRRVRTPRRAKSANIAPESHRQERREKVLRLPDDLRSPTGVDVRGTPPN